MTLAAEAFKAVRDALAKYAFTSHNEADLQAQVATALTMDGLAVRREVIADDERSRYDLLVRAGSATVVLELKLGGSAPAVERQAQRYAMSPTVDAVAVVTTSNRLAREIEQASRSIGLDTLGGKPFAVITLRTSI